MYDNNLPTIAFSNYAAAIEHVRNAQEAAIMAARRVTEAEVDLEHATANEFQNHLEAAADVAKGSNETARKERRLLWMASHYEDIIREADEAQHEKRKADMKLEHARDIRSLRKLECQALTAGIDVEPVRLTPSTIDLESVARQITVKGTEGPAIETLRALLQADRLEEQA